MARLEALVIAGEKRERNACFNQNICECGPVLTIKANVEQDGIKVALDEFVACHGSRVRKA